MLTLQIDRFEDGRVIGAINHFSINQDPQPMPGWSSANSEQYLSLPELPIADAASSLSATLEFLKSFYGIRDSNLLTDTASDDIHIVEAAAWFQETRGIEKLKQNSAWFAQNFEPTDLKVQMQTAEGASAAIAYQLTGVFTGDTLGHSTRGNTGYINGFLLASVRDGRVFHAFSHLDLNELGRSLPVP